MLRQIRDKTGSLVVKIILGLLIISFGAWGVGDMVTFRSQDLPVAKIGGEEITRTDVENEVRREIARLNPQFGNQLTPDTARLLGLPQSVLGRMVTDALLLDEAGQLSIAVSDATVRQEVQGNPAFQSTLGAGNFDRQRLQNLLYQYGLSEREYLERVRQDVARSMLIDTVERGLTPPRVLNEAVFKFREEKRIAETIFISDAGTTLVQTPTETELRAYHKANPAAFTAPELRRLTMIALRSEDLADETAISDAEIAKAFEEREESLGIPEKRDLQQMFLADKATADKARAELAGGMDFLDVAKRLAGMDADGTNLGTATKSDVITEIADAAFSAPVGTVTEPIPGPGGIGFYLVKVNKIEAAKTANLEAAAPELRTTLAREKSVDTLYSLVNRVEDEISKGATLEETAAALSVKAIKIAAIDQNGNGADGAPLTDTPVAPGTIAAAAFATEPGADSTVQDGGDDVYFVVRVDAITPPTVRSYESVKADVRAAVDAERRRDIALSVARNTAERLKKGENTETVAKELGANLAVTNPLKRHYSRSVSGIPAQLLQDIFKLDNDGASVTRGEDGYFVTRLKQVIPADANADKDGRAAVEDELTVVMRNDLVTQLATALRQKKGVTVNQDVLRQVLDPTAGQPQNY